MNTASEARKNIKYLSSVLRGLVALDAELEEVGSIERMVTQKQSALDVLTREEAAARERIDGLSDEYKAKVADAETRAAAITVQAEGLLVEAKDQHNATVAESEKARGDIADMLAAATQSAEDVVTNGRAEAERLVNAATSDANNIVAAAKSKEAAANERIGGVNERLAALNAECEAAQARLDEINAETDRVLKRFQKA